MTCFRDKVAAADFTAGQWQRKEARTPWDSVLVRVAMKGGDFIPVSAQIINMSKSGVGLLMAKLLNLRPGLTVVIELDSLLITGCIRHCDPSRVGTGPFYVGLQIENIELTPRIGLLPTTRDWNAQCDAPNAQQANQLILEPFLFAKQPQEQAA